MLRATFPGIRDSVKELVGKHMDSLARKFVRNHNMKVKDEIERLAREYGNFKEPVGVCVQMKVPALTSPLFFHLAHAPALK